MKLARLLAVIIGSSAFAQAACAQAERIQGRVDGYISLVEATDEADGPSLAVYRTLAVDLEKSREGYASAVRELSDRKFDSLVAAVDDQEFAGTLKGLAPAEAREKFIAQLDRDFVDLEIVLADSLAESDRKAVLDTATEVRADVEKPETAQAFETGKHPIWSGKAAENGGNKVGEVVGKPAGKVVGPALGAVLSTTVIAGSAVLRVPVYFALKFTSALARGFVFAGAIAWEKSRPARQVIGRWAAAGWNWTSERFKEARESVRKGWEDVRKFLKERFGRGGGN